MTAADRRIVLEFRSPTVFHLLDEKDDDGQTPRRSPRRMHVLPDPALVFGELAGRWDGLTGGETQAATRAFAAARVVVARHDIRTHMYDYGNNRKQIGFTGRVAYELLGHDPADPPLLRHLNRLADLAFFTGVGSKTTQGMGQVWRVMSDE